MEGNQEPSQSPAPPNPIMGVGLLRRWKPGDQATETAKPYLGTCFAFRWQNRFITARHCIEGIPDDELVLESGPARGFLQTVGDVWRHPTADIAVFETGGIGLAAVPVQPFRSIATERFLGEEFFAFGYPVDVLGPDATEPTPRLFKGSFQRFMPNYRSYSGYNYAAGELSFACPGGLSGGPLFRTNDLTAVFGLATENLRSTTHLEAVEDHSVNGTPSKRIEYREVISYGTALMLSDVSDWLDQWIPLNPTGAMGSLVGRAEKPESTDEES